MSVFDSLPGWAREPGNALTTAEAVGLAGLSGSRLSSLARDGRVRRAFISRLAPVWCKADILSYVNKVREGAAHA